MPGGYGIKRFLLLSILWQLCIHYFPFFPIQQPLPFPFPGPPLSRYFPYVFPERQRGKRELFLQRKCDLLGRNSRPALRPSLLLCLLALKDLYDFLPLFCVGFFSNLFFLRIKYVLFILLWSCKEAGREKGRRNINPLSRHHRMFWQSLEFIPLLFSPYIRPTCKPIEGRSGCNDRFKLQFPMIFYDRQAASNSIVWTCRSDVFPFNFWELKDYREAEARDSWLLYNWRKSCCHLYSTIQLQ